jgi:glucokinase
MDVIGAVDIGGTKIAIGVVTRQGQVLDKYALPSRRDQTFEHTLKEISSRLESMVNKAGCNLAGIGIGSTGQVDSATGLVLRNAFLPNWSGQNPVSWLSDRFGVPSALENDADAAALAEWSLGAGINARRFIYLTISTGIGGGMIFDGQVFRGAEGVHPEVGHHTVDPAGPQCFCGNRGCWETLASGRALQARMRAVRSDFEGDAAKVCDLAEAGEPAALEVVNAHGEAIGIGLANLITLFAPDVIVIGGGLMRREALFMPAAQRAIFERCHLVSARTTRLALSEFGADTALVGAAQVWAYHFSVQGS